MIITNSLPISGMIVDLKFLGQLKNLFFLKEINKIIEINAFEIF